MGKGAKIAIALVACIAIWLVFAIINAAAGNKHGGGIIVMMIMFGIITFVWKSIVGKTDSDEELITVNLHTGSGDNRADFEVQLTNDELIKMADIRKQDPEKWQDNEVELVREARKILKRTTKETIIEEPQKPVIIEEHEGPVQTEMPIEIISEENEKAVPLKPSSNPRGEKQNAPSVNLFGNKLESENRRQSNSASHIIRQDDIDICINIDDSVYRKMIELQNENPQKWVNKELDLFKYVKDLSKA